MADDADCGERGRSDFRGRPRSIRIVATIDTHDQSDRHQVEHGDREQDAGYDSGRRRVQDSAETVEQQEQRQHYGAQPEQGQRDRRHYRGSEKPQQRERALASRL